MPGSLGRDERWAIVTDVAETARILTLNASDDPAIPPAADLRWTHRDRLRHAAVGRLEPPWMVEVFALTRVAESTAGSAPPTGQH